MMHVGARPNSSRNAGASLSASLRHAAHLHEGQYTKQPFELRRKGRAELIFQSSITAAVHSIHHMYLGTFVHHSFAGIAR